MRTPARLVAFRAVFCAALALTPAVVVAATPDIRFPGYAPVARFEAERDFIVGEGRRETGRVRTHNDEHRAGYTLVGIDAGGVRGIALGNGTYRWRFRVGRMGDPAFLPASPVWTLLIVDVTRGETLATRRVDASDLDAEGVYVERTLLHSTVGREGDRFEARVYWHGMVNAIVDAVDLERAVSAPVADLERQAFALDRDLRERFLDPLPGLVQPGQLVARKVDDGAGGDRADQRGDAFT